MHGSTGGSWKRSTLVMATGVAHPTGKPAEHRPRALQPAAATAPALDPTNLIADAQPGSTVNCTGLPTVLCSRLSTSALQSGERGMRCSCVRAGRACQAGRPEGTVLIGSG